MELNARGEILITAPVDGIVTNLIAEIGHHLQPAKSLVTIVPENSELKAVLLIPTRAYGFVQAGQATQEPVYRVEATLAAQEIRAYGDAVKPERATLKCIIGDSHARIKVRRIG
ncbi:HlyD family efflux transporter periplasmic adaptor subunit [Aliidiomarina sedimenti]|uniref:HlyD family efflux transporter periplasmic adaptor subunit n=1 Tax=Aliidiomarina sedimenti TaxID=1933879 RepID=UPI001F5435E2|nr:HlyD family efflux transporter periplasmic adaptor subunit [Aliidiomarina sedimenti]